MFDPPAASSPGAHAAEAIDLSVIVPCLDEAGSIPTLVAELSAAFPVAGPTAVEFILVDDGSADTTREVLARCVRAEPRLHPVLRARRGGQSRALQDGLLAARGEWIAHLDGDLQNDPGDLPGLLAHARKDLDAVFGYRATREDSAGRRRASRIANRLRKLVLRDSIVDIGCSTRVVRRAVLQTLPPLRDLHRYLPALVERAGWRVEQAPTHHRPRQHGRSKYTNLGRTLRAPLDLCRMARLARRLRIERRRV